MFQTVSVTQIRIEPLFQIQRIVYNESSVVLIITLKPQRRTLCHLNIHLHC